MTWLDHITPIQYILVVGPWTLVAAGWTYLQGAR
jgi:hypothetical protein